MPIRINRSRGSSDSLSPATGAKFALLPPENATGNLPKSCSGYRVKIRIPDPRPGGQAAARPPTEVIVDTRTPDPVVAAHRWRPPRRNWIAVMGGPIPAPSWPSPTSRSPTPP